MFIAINRVHLQLDIQDMTSANSEFNYFSDTFSAFSSINSRNSNPDHVCQLESFPEWKVTRDDSQSKEYWNVRQELYDSEKAYLGYLCLLQKLYINPLAKLPKLVSRQDLRGLFADLTSIYMMNRELLFALRNTSTVYEAFESLVPFLKLYTSYAGNYQNSQKIYSKLMTKNDFRLFVEQQESDARSVGIKLMALLIMPIQRIPRYILLIKRLKDETTDTEEVECLKRILLQMGDITSLLDSCISEYEQGEKLWFVQESLGIKEGIVGPGRRLIKEGPLFKRNLCGLATYHERYFWLFNDILVYGKRRFGPGPKYECSCIFQLRHVQVTHNPYEGSLLVTCRNHSLTLTADSYELMDQWYKTMTDAIERIKVLRKTLRKESSKQPVKEFKSQLRRKFTNKFVNTNYVYSVNGNGNNRVTRMQKLLSEAMASPTDVDISKSPFAKTNVFQHGIKNLNSPKKVAETPETEDIENEEVKGETPLRKRRRKNTFDRELETAVRKRRLTDEITPIEEESPGSSNRNSRVHDQENWGTPMLNQSQIRKYSYMEPMTPDCRQLEQGSPTPLEKTSVSPQEMDEPPRSSRRVPWWLEESQPAEFRNSQRRTGAFGNACTLL